jgi:hypothetical protein
VDCGAVRIHVIICCFFLCIDSVQSVCILDVVQKDVFYYQMALRLYI